LAEAYIAFSPTEWLRKKNLQEKFKRKFLL
jgi:hypothetical protein